METAIIVLAAGKGTRMKSALPKVLHKLGGKTLLDHVLHAALPISQRIVVVAGHGADQVKATIVTGNPIFVEQTEQLGTGHAVMQAMSEVEDTEKVLVLYGDVPLINSGTINSLLDVAGDKVLGLLTINLENPTGYGRIVRNQQGEVIEIVEQKDANPEQLLISEVNTGIIAVNTNHLKSWLPQLQNNNAQGEYYLTDLIAIARESGVEIRTMQPDSQQEVEGVNDRNQLAQLERYYQLSIAKTVMANGNTLLDPSRFDCRGQLETGQDNVIDVNCLFEGNVVLGSGISIGANCIIKDSRIADGVQIKPHSVIEGAEIAEGVDIGPFARIRPGTKLEKNSRVGNFVETKNARVGEGSKINHLSYVGDAVLGRDVNVGAGTITCNYDGANKHLTEIGDNAFIGSNSALVAPVKIGKSATVGAGSAISKQVADDSLALTRSEQVEIKGWERPTKAKKS